MLKEFVVGIVGSPFGLEGFVKVKPFSNDVDNLLKLKDVTLRIHNKEIKIKIDKSAALKTHALLHFTGRNNPETVKELIGAEIIVKREDASPLSAGEFYVEDLKGLAVISNDDNTLLGHITDIIEGGGGELAEIKLCSGQMRLIPFLKKFFTEINLQNKKALLQNCWILE